MTATTEHTATLTVPAKGAGVDIDTLRDFIRHLPRHALVSMRPGSQLDGESQIILTARWTPRKEA